MKQRVLVMNGSRLLESQVNGEWQVSKVEPAGKMKPGIHNIFNAKEADKTKQHKGVIIHADKNSIYQEVGKGVYVKHDTFAFLDRPAMGDTVQIDYDGSLAQPSPVQGRQQGRSR